MDYTFLLTTAQTTGKLVGFSVSIRTIRRLRKRAQTIGTSTALQHKAPWVVGSLPRCHFETYFSNWVPVRCFLGKPRVTNNFTGTRPQLLSMERESAYRLDPRRFSSFDHLQDANEFADKLHVHLF
jgi:hypothetical protein